MLRNMAVSQMFTHGRGVLAFGPRIIVGLARARLGLLDPELLQQLRHLMVDVFRTVIAVETQDHEREGRHHGRQHRQQECLADFLHGADHLKLGHFIHRIDEVHPLDVETAQQRDLLAAAGCGYSQGFLFSKAVPAEEFEALLKRGNP